MSLVLVAVGVAANPAVLVLAAVFGVVTAILWYHASGRLASRVYRRVERQAAVDGGSGAGVGAGPKDAWRGPHRRRGRARGRRAGTSDGTRRRRPGTAQHGRAYEVLGLEPGADQAAIRRAYRQRIKEVHPDTEGGDEAAFRRVRRAYERLSE